MNFIIMLAGFSFFRGGNSKHHDEVSWPKACSIGTRQSPIDITMDDIVFANLPPFDYINYKRYYRASVKNNGHSIVLELDSDNSTLQILPSITGRMFNNSMYSLHDVHFHWGSEHTIIGYKYPLEAHFVHYKSSAGNITNALEEEDGIVVLAVLYVTEARNKAFSDILENIRTISHNVGPKSRLKRDMSLRTLLPQHTGTFFTYKGSLTTPSCREGITWIIFNQPATIGKSQLTTLTRISAEDNEPLYRNDRSVQNINGRKIKFNGGIDSLDQTIFEIKRTEYRNIMDKLNKLNKLI